MIWWLWDAYSPPQVHTFSVNDAWSLDPYFDPEPDVFWLGEVAWTARSDNMSLGLVTA